MKKFKIVFTIGIGLDAQNNEISFLTYKELSNKTFKAIASTYGGYTAKETVGGWVDGEGNLIEEKSLQVESLIEVSDIETATRQAETIAFSLCALWNQQCVVCEVQETNFNFINQSISFSKEEGVCGDIDSYVDIYNDDQREREDDNYFTLQTV